MTDEKMALLELMQKSGGSDFLKELAQTVLQRLMEFEVEGLTGAARHERSESRITHRNGYRERGLDTRLGRLELRIPKRGQGSYFPYFLEPRKTAEQALVAVIQEAWIKGISTRKIDDLVQTMGLSGISKSQVSSLCQEIDERVKGFLNRLITGEWAYLWLDATYLKVREGGRVVSVAAIIVVGVNQDGRREILGLGIGPSEAATFWLGFLRGLQQRGLSVVHDRLVEHGPEALGRLQLGCVGRQVDEPDPVRDGQVRLGVPTGIVEHEHDGALAPGPGLVGEGGQKRGEERLGDARREIPDRLAREGRRGGREVGPLVGGRAAG